LKLCLVTTLVLTTLACGANAAQPAPTVSSVSPSSASAGANAFTLTVTGSGFTGHSSVLWNGSTRATTVLNSSQLKAAISSADVASAGTAIVTVSGWKGKTSNAVQFTIGATIAALQITSGAMPSATVNTPYSFTLTAKGGTQPYAWSQTSGQLPPGLSLSNTGVISGTPNTSGNFSFGVRVQDSSSSAQTASAPELINTTGTTGSGPVDVAHFSMQPATGVFAEDGGGYSSAQCAAALDPHAASDIYNGHPINQETVPENQQSHAVGVPNDGITTPANQTKPTATQLAYYASDGYVSTVMDPPYTWMKMVDGQYTGTTEMIIRWAACKWGIDEDMIRAQGMSEAWTWVQWNARGDQRSSITQCQAGNNATHDSTNLWGYLVSNACYQSWSIWQTKVVYASPNEGAWTTWPAINESTAFAADYRYGSQRSCMNGDQSSYFNGVGAGGAYLNDVANAKYDPNNQSPHNFWNPVTGKYATNLEYVAFGCVSSHFSGLWMDSGAQSYLSTLLTHWKNKDWLPK
jgi:Putative Ig domain